MRLLLVAKLSEILIVRAATPHWIEGRANFTGAALFRLRYLLLLCKYGVSDVLFVQVWVSGTEYPGNLASDCGYLLLAGLQNLMRNCDRGHVLRSLPIHRLARLIYRHDTNRALGGSTTMREVTLYCLARLVRVHLLDFQLLCEGCGLLGSAA